MQRHAEIGDGLIATVRSLDRVRPIVRHHHERIDGQGYPDGLRGDDIPLLAQIVSVVDVFDALTTDRLYRKALSIETAYKMLNEKAVGGWCQASVVECFIELHRSREFEAAPATKSNRVVSVQTHMRRADLGNMFAPLLASGRINQLHGRAPRRKTLPRERSDPAGCAGASAEDNHLRCAETRRRRARCR